MDIKSNRTHRWIPIQMLTMIFAVQKLVNNIIFRMNRMMPLTRNRLSDAFTTLFSQHAPLGRTVRLNIYWPISTLTVRPRRMLRIPAMKGKRFHVPKVNVLAFHWLCWIVMLCYYLSDVILINFWKLNQAAKRWLNFRAKSKNIAESRIIPYFKIFYKSVIFHWNTLFVFFPFTVVSKGARQTL